MRATLENGLIAGIMLAGALFLAAAQPVDAACQDGEECEVTDPETPNYPDRDPRPDEDGWNEPPDPQPEPPDPCTVGDGCGRGEAQR